MPLTDALARRGAALLAHVFARRWAGAAAGALAGRRLGVVGLGSLAALVAAAALALTPVGAQSPETDAPELPPGLDLLINLVADSDNIVPPGGSLTAAARLTLTGEYNLDLAAPYDQRVDLDVVSAGLRLSGAFDWEANGSGHLALPVSAVGNGGQFRSVDDAITGKSPAANNPDLATTDRGIFQAVAWDGRTMIGRSWGVDSTVNDRVLQIIDTSTTPPTWKALLGSQETNRRSSWHRFGLGFDEASLTPGFSSVAVWHEDDDTAWLFVGAEGTLANGASGEEAAGALYIYKLEYDAAGGLTVGTGSSWNAVLRPTQAERQNRFQPNSGNFQHAARYGSSVAISADGSTLLVSARVMNHVGAAYVYTRPAAGWGDVGDGVTERAFYDGGVKISVVAIPSWGPSNNANFRPFDSSDPADCDSYCRQVTAQITRNGSHHDLQEGVEFGIGQMGISADGRVIAIGAPGKQFPASTAGGGFSGGVDQGEVYVFEAPAGGWSSVRDYTAGRTQIATNADASGFNPGDNYSPGPAKRVVSPTATLRPTSSWTGTAENFGTHVDVSADGGVVAVASGSSGELNLWFDSWSDAPAAYIFERSGSGWRSSTMPAATFTLGDRRGWAAWGFDLHPDGETLLFGQRVWSDDTGRTVVIKKGSGWSDWELPLGAGANADEIEATSTRWQLSPPQGRATPTNQETWFGAPLYDLDGQRLAISAPGDRHPGGHPGRVWIMGDAAGGCTGRTLDEVTSINCALAIANGQVVLPPGTSEGSFTISGEVQVKPGGSDVDPTTLRGALEVTIGTVDEVASVSLGVATDLADPTISSDDRPYPSTLKRKGDSTRLLLSVLNANGTASAQGSVSSVLVTTDAGELGLLDSSLSSNCQGLSCQLDVSRVTAANSDRLVFTLTHAGRATAATVNATVFSAAGNSYETEPVEITLAGAAASIAIAEPTRAVLNVDAGSTVDDETFDDTTDTRDQLVLAVTAVDAAGVGVDVPTSGRRATVTDADGKRVTNGVTATFPHRENAAEPVDAETNPAILDLARNVQASIEVNRGAADPLRPGEYTLTVYAGGKTATQAFTVTGGPASDGMSISDPGSPVVGDTFSVTVMVEDAEGNPVPDGTVVEWEPLEEERRTVLAEGALAVQTSATTRTKEGKVTAEYLVVDAGVIVIKVHAAPASAARRVELQPAPRQPSEDPTVDLTNRNPEGFSVWLGVGETTASALLERLDGPNTLAVWLDGDWRYYRATAAGAVGEDFAVRPGALLWVDLR